VTTPIGFVSLAIVVCKNRPLDAIVVCKNRPLTSSHDRFGNGKRRCNPNADCPRAGKGACRLDETPLGFFPSPRVPRVVRSSRPWAGGLNPVGILSQAGHSSSATTSVRARATAAIKNARDLMACVPNDQLTDGGHEARRLEQQRETAVRFSAWSVRPRSRGGETEPHRARSSPRL